jgi:hypothetical protein
MPIRFTYDQQRKILFTTAEGLVSFEDIEKHLDQETAEKALGYPELVDASAAWTNLPSEEVRQIVLRLQAMRRTVQLGPTAIVTTNDMFFGMARMAAILCELQGGPNVGVFRTFDEGLDWLVTVPSGAGKVPS